MIKINNGTIKFKTAWSELTFDEIEKLMQPNIDLFDRLAILSGTDKDFWLNLNVDEADKVLPFVSFIHEKPQAPEGVLIDGKYIELPKNIEFKAFGYKVHFQKCYQDWVEKKLTFADFCKKAAKIYIHAEISDRYSDEGIESIVLPKMDDSEAFAIMDFFLSSLI